MVVTAELLRDKLLKELEAVHVVWFVSNTCLSSLNTSIMVTRVGQNK